MLKPGTANQIRDFYDGWLYMGRRRARSRWDAVFSNTMKNHKPEASFAENATPNTSKPLTLTPSTPPKP